MKYRRSISFPLSEGESFFLLGPRGVGKTSLIQELLSTAWFLKVNLLESKTFRRLLRDPSILKLEIEQELLKKKEEVRPLIIFIDEVQKLPELLDEIHNLMELYPQHLQFILTGSSARKLKRSGANLLAGRASVKYLYPFSSQEVSDFDLTRVLQFGTLPRAYISGRQPYGFLEAYVGMYLKEEIQSESVVRNLEAFHRFLEVAAQANGSFINFTKIARDCHISANTVQSYFSILVDTLVVVRLDPWTRSVREQLKKQPKFYFFDLGVLNAIRGELRLDLKPSSYRYGNLFESWIIQELCRWNNNLDAGLRFYLWHDEDGNEVDCIVDRGVSEPPVAIEIKSSTSPGADDFKGMLKFGEYHLNATLICLSNVPHAYTLEGKIQVFPWKEGLEALFSGQFFE